MAKEKDGDFKIRFRHTAGDIGPWTFKKDASIHAVKERLAAEWPKDGPLAVESPSSPCEIILILAGHYVDSEKALFDYRREITGIETAATMHVMIRKKIKKIGKKKIPQTNCCVMQ